MSSSDDQPQAARRLPRPRIAAAVVVAVVLIGIAVGAVQAGQRWSAERALVMADPDAILVRPQLASRALAEGRTVFATTCAACHGSGAANRRTGVPDLTDRDFLYGSGRVSEIEDIVRHGIRAGDRRGRNFAYMPAYASAHPYAAEPIPPLTPAEVRDVVAALMQRGGRPAEAGAAARGNAIFLGKGGCYDCHGGDGKGDPSIGAPNLADNIWLYGDGSATAVGDAIEHGAKGYSPAYAGRLQPAEIRAVAVYVASLAKPHGPTG